MSVVRVLVVDDDEAIRQVLVELLNADSRTKCVGALGSMRSALDIARQTRPDVALMDVRMPGGGPDAVAAMRMCSPATRSVAVSGDTDGRVVRGMLEAGASGYLVKGTIASDLVDAVVRFAGGPSVREGEAAGASNAQPLTAPGHGAPPSISSQRPIRVLVADDEPAMRATMADLVRDADGMELVADAADADEAIEAALRYRPRVAVVDVGMPCGGGRRVARELRAVAPEIAVLALSGFDDRGNVFEMLRAGASGYLVKGATSDEIVAAIRGAGSGQGVLSAQAAGHVVERLVGEPRPRSHRPGGAIRVMVVDHDEAVLAALGAALAGDPAIELAGLASDRYAAVTIAATHRPDVALVDVGMPDGGGALAASEILHNSPETNILAVSPDQGTGAVLAMRGAGAIGYIVPGSSELTRQVHAAARGEATLAPEVTKAVVDELVVGLQRERDETAERRAETESIRSIIAEDEGLRMIFQPIVELDSGRMYGLEALARFDLEPRRTPDVWFHRAAMLGLGVDLELAAVRAAVAQVDELPSDAALSINVSPDTIASPRLAEALGSAASRIILELTEHAPVDEYGPLLSALAPLRSAGLRVAVDDAGAGFSSLRHILRLEPTLIKLDITLCRSIDSDPRRQALADLLAVFAQDIGADLVAEGIETQSELDTLRSFNVRYGQGYLLAKGAPLDTRKSMR
jgi:DNA-binding NarL/FixJ family response regulator/EAL domain-containing protein (putative c-di-GMP-specific phosphodiesterase class I)